MQIFWGSPLAKFGMTRKERKIQIGEIRHNADHFRLHHHLLSSTKLTAAEYDFQKGGAEILKTQLDYL